MVEPAMYEAAREAGLLEPGQRLLLVLAETGRKVQVSVAEGTGPRELRTRPLIPGQRLRFSWTEIGEVHQRV